MKPLLPLLLLVLGAACGGTPVPPPAPAPLPPGGVGARDGRILVGGQPFFVHGYYYVSRGQTPEQLVTTLRTLHEAGFNTVHATRTPDNGYPAFLAEASHLGMKVLTEGAGPEAVRALRAEPSVLGWNIGDDVHENLTPAQLRAHHEQLKAVDPEHLTYFTVFSPERWGPYLAQGDVVGAYNYPVSSARLGMVDSVMTRLRAERRTSIGIVQAFAWPGDRAPTPAELRNMAYQYLVNDVGGLLYYNFIEGGTPLPTLHPELWEATRQLAPEVQRLTPALTRGSYLRLSSGARGVAAAAWRLGGELYVAVVDTEASGTREVSIPLPLGTLGPAQPLFPGRPQGLQLRGGRLQGTVRGQEVHVYVLAAG